MKLPRFLLPFVIFITMVLRLPGGEGKTVVLFPPPSTSYIVYHANVAQALADMSHDVWLCVPHYLLKKDLVKSKSIKILPYAESLGDITATLFRNTHILDKFWAGESRETITTVLEVSREVHNIVVEILSEDAFIESVRKLQPDLLVLDSIPFFKNMLVLPYKLDIPYALIGTFHDVLLARVPFSPAATPFFTEDFSDRMNFFQRLKLSLLYFIMMTFDIFSDNTMVTRFAPDKPYVSLNDLAAKAEIFIAEIDHILDYPRPMLPNTKLIGGSSASPAKPLAAEFKKFVASAKTGIIVVSFGGSVLNIPPHISSKMVKAFNQLDLKVVWRVNLTSPDPQKIMTSTWLPQNDLLGQPETKIFVSHCGKNGQYEALFHAVPILCVPINGDQFYNAERIQAKGFGLRTDLRTVSADDLANMLKQIIRDSKYKENIQKASLLFHELYKVPMKEAAYWLDHVMKYGGDYMRSVGQEMPMYQFLLLDVFAFVFAVILVFVMLWYCVLKCCCRLCCHKGKDKSKQE